jgi:hypothetical protein
MAQREMRMMKVGNSDMSASGVARRQAPHALDFLVWVVMSDLPVGSPADLPVQPLLQKYSGFPKKQITLTTSPAREIRV